MTSKETVLAVWPDAEASKAFAAQPVGEKRWMWCIMSSLKCRASRGSKRVQNVGAWMFSEQEAWDDAASRLEAAHGK